MSISICGALERSLFREISLPKISADPEEKGLEDLALMLDRHHDDALLIEILTICKQSPSQFKQLVEHPVLAIRFLSLSEQVFVRKTSEKWSFCFDTPFTVQFRTLLEFIQNNAPLLRDLHIQRFIAIQLVRIQTAIIICQACELPCSYLRYRIQSLDILKLIYSDEVPTAIKEPLRDLYLYQTHPVRAHIQMAACTETAQAEQNRLLLARMIDGNENKEKGLIHVLTTSPEMRAAEFIRKVVREFQSGRRCFVFTWCNHPVPMQNYKEVMLYVVRAIKDDLAAHRDKFSRYEDPKFESPAKQLFALEGEIASSRCDHEIERCLDKFYKVYCEIPNCNMDLTVATCISRKIFDLRYICSSGFKPLIRHGIPPRLMNQCAQMNRGSDFSQEGCMVVFEDLFMSTVHHPIPVRDAFVELETIHRALSAGDRKPELAERFRKIWASVPMKRALPAKSDKEIDHFFKFCQVFEIGDTAPEMVVLPLRFEHIKKVAQCHLLMPFYGLREKIEAIRKSCCTKDLSLANCQRRVNSLLELRQFIFTEILAHPVGHYGSHVEKSLQQINILLFETAPQVSRYRKGAKEQSDRLIVQIAVSLGFLERGAEGAHNLVEVLQREHAMRLVGYSELRRMIENSPRFLRKMRAGYITVENVVETMLEFINSGMISLLNSISGPTPMPPTACVPVSE